MASFGLGYGHYMLAADRREIGMRDYDLRCSKWDWINETRVPDILPPPTPLWHWAVW